MIRSSLTSRMWNAAGSACLALVLLFAAACEDSEPSAPAAPSPTQRPVPSPTVAPDPELAAQLRDEGEYVRAADAFGAVARATKGEARQAALLSQAQALMDAGHQAGARGVLDTLLAEADAASADAILATFMRGRILLALDDDAGALAAFTAYTTTGGPLTPYALAETAQIQARQGLLDDARATADAVMKSVLREEYRAAFALAFGEELERAGDDAGALAAYAQARALGGDEASALAHSGAVKLRLGDASWADDYAVAIARYPAAAGATEWIAALDAAAVPLSDYLRGVVDYRAYRDTDARAAFGRAIAADDHAAEATYYIAAMDERAGSIDAAIDGYARSYALDPASPQADDALWWRGRLLEIARRYEEAERIYAELASALPASPWVPDGQFHRALVLYRSGAYEGAAFGWGTLAQTSRGHERARALYWQGRAEQAAGFPQWATTLGTITVEFPDDYYGLRARVLLVGADKQEDAIDLDQRVDWTAIAAYLAKASGFNAAAPAPADGRWQIADDLERAGLRAESAAVALSKIADAEGDVARLYHITRRLHDGGRADLSARAAVSLLRAMGTSARDAPLDLYRVAYPAPYARLVEDAAREQGVSPLLLLALVRQESFFDARAGSPAGAIGLTQVIEPTGRTIAAELGIATFELADLYRPALSLRFGAHYLAQQIAAFDGNVYHALAAYNGGPGASHNAIEAGGDDIDLFVEDLEFDETRLYVRLVLENYARYRQLYAGADAPSLP